MDVGIGTIKTILENEFGFDPPVSDKDAIERWESTFKEIAERTPIGEAYFAPL